MAKITQHECIHEPFIAFTHSVLLKLYLFLQQGAEFSKRGSHVKQINTSQWQNTTQDEKSHRLFFFFFFYALFFHGNDLIHYLDITKIAFS